MCCLAASCTSSRVEPEDVPHSLGDEILFSARQSGMVTKSMLEKEDFAAKGSCLRVYDAYTPTTWTNADFYINDAYAVSLGDGGIWPFRAGADVASAEEHYYWTKTGKHRFYGVLGNDNAGLATPSEWEFDSARKVFSVPSSGTYTLGLNATQYDFLYSNIVERDLDNGGSKSSVQLEFSHLFSAFAFTLQNDSPESLTITDVKLKAGNVGSAKIDYSVAWQDKEYEDSKAIPAVTYSELTMSPATGIQGVATESSPKTMDAEAISNLFIAKDYGKIAEVAKDDYRLAWPQDLKGKTLEVTYQYEKTITETVECYSYVGGNGSYRVSFTDTGSGSKDYNKISSYWSSYYQYVGKGKGKYAVEYATTSGLNKYYNKVNVEEYVTTTETKTMTINLSDITPDAKWVARNRYLYSLVYSHNQISLKVTVMQWETGKGGDAIFE